MKCIKTATLSVLVFIMALWLNPAEARAETYTWKEDATVSGNDISAAWYNENDERLDGMPGSIENNDFITIKTTPNEECSLWLKSLSGDMNCVVTSFYDGEIQLGTEGVALNLGTLNAYRGSITLYGNVSGMRVEWCNELNIYGNVGWMMLGDNQASVGTGTVNITGNVDDIDWTQKALTAHDYYAGFAGSVYVGGTVGSGSIQNTVYDSVIQQSTWQIIGEIGVCDTGVFRMVDGVLSEDVPVTDVAPTLGSYYHQYQCYSREGSYGTSYWNKQYYNTETRVLAYQEECRMTDIPEGAYVQIYGVMDGDEVILDVNLSGLEIHNENKDALMSITVNGDIERVSLTMNALTAADISFNGTVNNLYCHYKSGLDYDINVPGKIRNVQVYDYGFFSCENMTIMTDGEWNSELFFELSSSSSSVAYQPISTEETEDVLSGYGIGTTVVVGEDTIVKTGQVSVTASNNQQYQAAADSNEVQSALEMIQSQTVVEQDKEAVSTPLLAVNIDVQTMYVSTATGETYAGDERYASENVTQLLDGKQLTVTLKIPDNVYESGAKYDVVNYHLDENGGATAYVLDSVQNGTEITFSTDKFSTFVLVKTTQQDKAPEGGSENNEGNESDESGESDTPGDLGDTSETVSPGDSDDTETVTPGDSDNTGETVSPGGSDDTETVTPGDSDNTGETVSPGGSDDTETVTPEDSDNPGETEPPEGTDSPCEPVAPEELDGLVDDVPRTGDSSSLILWCVIVFACVLFALRMRRCCKI